MSINFKSVVYAILCVAVTACGGAQDAQDSNSSEQLNDIEPTSIPTTEVGSIPSPEPSQAPTAIPTSVPTPTPEPPREPTQKTLIIEEQENGYCGVDDGGLIETEHSGFMGTGYVNTANTDGATIYWNIAAQTAGMFRLQVRYANGDAYPRNAKFVVNDIDGEIVLLPPSGEHPGDWRTYVLSAEIPVYLNAGYNAIKLTAITNSGLPNIDNLSISGVLQERGECDDSNVILLPTAVPSGIPTATPRPTSIPTQPPSPTPTVAPSDAPLPEPEPQPQPTQAPSLPQLSSAQISWDIPTTRQNGTNLLLSEIGGYEIKYRNTQTSNYTAIVLNDGTVSTYTLENLSPGEYEVKISTYDTEGIYSQASEASFATIGF